MFVSTRVDHDCPSFSFLGRSLWAHKEIMCAPLFCFRIDLCRHTRRSWLPLFSGCVDLHYMTFSSYRFLLAHVTGLSALLQLFGWGDQSRYFIVLVRYWCTVSTQSGRWWSLCLAYTRNHSRVIFMLKFGLVSLPFLVNNGSDKPSKSWSSLYVVGKPWENLKSI